jgi:hypothetical protein
VCACRVIEVDILVILKNSQEAAYKGGYVSMRRQDQRISWASSF